jgi:hypothetical protein
MHDRSWPLTFLSEHRHFSNSGGRNKLKTYNAKIKTKKRAHTEPTKKPADKCLIGNRGKNKYT